MTMKTILNKIEEMMNEQMKYISEAITLNDTNKKITSEEILKTLKLIKTELVKTNDNKIYKLNEQQEINTLIEMVNQRNKSIKEYINGNRNDLAEIEQNEINLIYKIIPQVKQYFDSLPNETDIENFTKEIINNYVMEKGENYQITMKDMSPIVKMVKAKYNNANGNIIKNVLQQYT